MSIFSPFELGHHLAHPLAHRADAGALGVDARAGRPDGDLGAVARLPGDGGDLDGAVGDLGHLEGEQLPSRAPGWVRESVTCGPLKPLRHVR